VLAAEEPSRIRGGTLFGGGGGPLDNYVGEVAKYVIRKATCRVILTAPPADVSPRATPRDEPLDAEPADAPPEPAPGVED
jgi:basic amino acid/polyamine antiporter, APA family